MFFFKSSFVFVSNPSTNYFILSFWPLYSVWNYPAFNSVHVSLLMNELPVYFIITYGISQWNYMFCLFCLPYTQMQKVTTYRSRQSYKLFIGVTMSPSLFSQRNHLAPPNPSSMPGTTTTTLGPSLSSISTELKSSKADPIITNFHCSLSSIMECFQ